MTQIATSRARRGRPCGVCGLPSKQRTALETQLATGVPISRICKQDWAPGRESIRHHLSSGHLRADLQERAERSQGLDYTSVLARIADIATRARQTALEAADAGDRAGTLKAGDSELRALSVLAAGGETSEYEIATRAAYQDAAAAVIRLARRGDPAAEAVATELDAARRPTLADDIREQFPESKGVAP